MTERPPRLVALDAFRGITIAGMILVNNPGSWGHVWAPLRHAAWHGWTPTDLVFPFFLFIVGVAIAIALGRRLEQGVPRGPIVRKVLVRGAVLFGLGLFLSAYPRIFTAPLDTLAGLRIPGVLQRIGVCYVIVSLGFLAFGLRAMIVASVVVLLGYWALMTAVPVPGVDAFGIDGKDTHLAAWLDRTVLGEAHLWRAARTWDPEGILSTLPACVTTVCGLVAGVILRSPAALERRVLDLFVLGAALVVAGWMWDGVLPINKPIWTSSYVLFTAGQAACGLALCLWACDLRGWRRWAQPFVVYGTNAITVFVGSALVARTLVMIPVGEGTLRSWIYATLFESWLDGKVASLAYAVAWVVGWYVVLRWMYRRGLFLKV